MAIELGRILQCAETGKYFIAQSDGFTFNYAQDSAGNTYSDEGVNFRERRELLDRSRPFTCYISSDGKSVTGWKGNKLGDIIQASTVRLAQWSAFHGKSMLAVKVRDVHGGLWYGRGSPGICINLRACKP